MPQNHQQLDYKCLRFKLQHKVPYYYVSQILIDSLLVPFVISTFPCEYVLIYVLHVWIDLNKQELNLFLASINIILKFNLEH